MRCSILFPCLVLPLLLASPAAAQSSPTRAQVNAGSVTILTDGLAADRSPATAAIRSLAREVSRIGKLRVLPIDGIGSTANLRDLLYLKGIDFAILNGDVLTQQDLFGPYRDARQKVR